MKHLKRIDELFESKPLQFKLNKKYKEEDRDIFEYNFTTEKGYLYEVTLQIKSTKFAKIDFKVVGESPVSDIGNFEIQKIFKTILEIASNHDIIGFTIESEPKRINTYKKIIELLGYKIEYSDKNRLYFYNKKG